MKVVIYNRQRDLPLSSPQIKRLIFFVIKRLKIDTSQVIFHFVSEKAISAVHNEIFNDPSVTDCITIPIDPLHEPSPHHLLGEAFICPKTAILYSQDHDLDPTEEVYRYVIHCLLHFAGYTDDTAEKRQQMRRKETSYLRTFFAARAANS